MFNIGITNPNTKTPTIEQRETFGKKKLLDIIFGFI